jgi:hypothetical protein
MGTPPFIFANRVLGANGIDPARDVQWRVYPAAELSLALEKGEIDAIADSEPIGSLLIAQGKVKNIADQAKDAPYKDEYCCAVILNGKFMANNPEASAAATRALLKGAKWVETNPAAAARLSVEKKYLASNPELNTVAFEKGMWGVYADFQYISLEGEGTGLLGTTVGLKNIIGEADFTLRPSRGSTLRLLAGLREDGEQEGGKDSDNGDHDQQLDERKGPASHGQSLCPAASVRRGAAPGKCAAGPAAGLDGRSVSAKEAARHSRTDPSALPVARSWPSGENASVQTQSVCPLSVASSWSTSGFHSRTMPSMPPEARVFPSGEKATTWQGPICPTNRRSRRPLARSQR